MRSSVARWRCYRYAGYYRVSARIYSPIRDAWVEANFLLDTGFKGDVFLEKRLYEELGLHLVELPLRAAPVARTLAGTVQLRAAVTKLGIAGCTFEVRAYTPLYGHGKNMIGRGVLGKLITLLKEREKTCVRLAGR